METNTPVIVLSGMRVRKLQNQAGVSLVEKRLTSPSALEGNKFHQLNKPPFGKLTPTQAPAGKDIVEDWVPAELTRRDVSFRPRNWKGHRVASRVQ